MSKLSRCHINIIGFCEYHKLPAQRCIDMYTNVLEVYIDALNSMMKATPVKLLLYKQMEKIMPNTPVSHWGPEAFEHMDDAELLQLLVVIDKASDGDMSDKNFMEAIRLEILRRNKEKDKEALHRMLADVPKDR